MANTQDQGKQVAKGNGPFVSIIIPTYNRAKMLGITIESFMTQNYPKDNYEIIVSDNNSFDNTREVVEEWQGKATVPLRYIFEGRQGVHYARNTAAKEAMGDILYFTDDDMIAADENLLLEIIKPFNIDEKVASVTGRVLPKWEQPPPPWIPQLCMNYLLSLNDRQDDLIISRADCGVFSCHQAISRNVFYNSGGFNPENTAGEWIGDGETGLNIKIREMGYKFAYAGDSVIYHIIPPSRMTQAYLNKRLANQGNCDSYTEYRKYRFSDINLLVQIVAHVIHIIGLFFGLALRIILVRHTWRLFLARIYYFKSRIRYDLRLIYDANWRTLVLKNDWLEE